MSDPDENYEEALANEWGSDESYTYDPDEDEYWFWDDDDE